MNAEMMQIFIPIVAILAVFGFPVALVFIWKWFKFKDKELQLDAEMRKTAGQALEARVQRLESIILALDSDLRAKLGVAPSLRTDHRSARLVGDQPGGTTARGARQDAVVPGRGRRRRLSDHCFRLWAPVSARALRASSASARGLAPIRKPDGATGRARWSDPRKRRNCLEGAERGAADAPGGASPEGSAGKGAQTQPDEQPSSGPRSR